MNGVLSTLVAVLGTILGVVVTHLFQRTSSERAQNFALGQQLRAERLTVYSDFAGAVTELRRGQQDRWHRRREDPESSHHFEARTESYRLRGVALHALFRVQLIADSPEVVDAARDAYEKTSALHQADDQQGLRANGELARERLEQFIVLASTDLGVSPDARPTLSGGSAR
ncbi:hypothetical protein [Streptomyces sp. NPDC058653]|uniref:hypothetical protein n=1 Tax=Streptomyces sp. NPDC058653 TaxID=3346576 RepID=UPI003648A413